MGGKLRFKLPRLSRGGSLLLWGSMGEESGEEKENTCRSLTATFSPTDSVIGCYYYQEESNNVWEMHSFNALATGSEFEFVIYGITNPTVTGDQY